MLHSDIQRRMTDMLKQLGVAALYALLIHLDHRYFETGTPISSFEAASGFALAVLLIGGKRYGWGVFLGAILTSVTTDPLGAAAIISSGHALEALCGAWLLTRDNKFDPAIRSLRDYLRLIFLGGGTGVGIAANIGVTALLVFGFITPESYLHELLHWWTGDMLGIVLITPLILVCWHTRNNWREVKRMAEAMLLLGLTFLAGQAIFFGWFHDSLGNIALGYWMFLFIAWVAVRLGTRGTVFALTMTAIQSMLGAFHGTGFFANDIAQTQLTNYWLYTLILSVVGMALAMFFAEQKRAEKELQRFFNLVPDMVCIASTDGYFKKINRAWQTTLGYTEQEILSTPFLDFIHPDDRDATMKEVVRQMAGETTFQFSNRYRCRDGSYRWLEWYTTPSVDKTQLFASARDITERKQAEAEREITLRKVERAQAMLQTVLDSTPDWIFAKDADYRFLFVNRAFAASQGCTPQDMAGRPDTDFWSAELCIGDPARGIRGFHADDDAAMAGKLIHNPNDPATFDDGKLHIFDTLKLPLLDADGHCYGVLGYARDITERKTIERQLRNLSAHMLSVREEEKASIAREIHDDLGGTLTALKMDAYWLSRKLPASEETAPLRERIASMSQLIDNAVGVTRRVISDLRPTMLDDLGLLAALEWQAGDFHKRTGIECRVNCIEDNDGLDKQRSIALFRIFQEALTNVARHSGASRVEVEFCHSDEEVFLSVSDNGRGMPEERTDASISYGILGMTERVEQLGGTVKFGRPPNGGFSVTVILPLPADNQKGGTA